MLFVVLCGDIVCDVLCDVVCNVVRDVVCNVVCDVVHDVGESGGVELLILCCLGVLIPKG